MKNSYFLSAPLSMVGKKNTPPFFPIFNPSNFVKGFRGDLPEVSIYINKVE